MERARAGCGVTEILMVRCGIKILRWRGLDLLISTGEKQDGKPENDGFHLISFPSGHEAWSRRFSQK